MIYGRMNKKQKEALVLALCLKKGETYREITKGARYRQIQSKQFANRAGLDESTSISSRAFELFSTKDSFTSSYYIKPQAENAIQLSPAILHAFRDY